MKRAIFLSASVPDPQRHPRYFKSMDAIAIRDAARALATVALPHATLYWGGHPSITPLVRVVAESMGLTGVKRVRLYQSAWFSDVLPADNAAFESYELTPKKATFEESIAAMRDCMLQSAKFDAAIFLGGMEGVEVEFELFRKFHPNAKVLPVASTGAAAKILYDRLRDELGLPEGLLKDYAYPSLFRRLLDLPATRGAARPAKDN
jgi:hypothetical protein